MLMFSHFVSGLLPHPMLLKEAFSKAFARDMFAREEVRLSLRTRLFAASPFLSRCLATEERREENGLRPDAEPESAWCSDLLELNE